MRATTCNQQPAGKVISQKMTQAGYMEVGLVRDKKQWYRRVNRLVCEAWHGTPVGGLHACHIDGSRTNNHFSNLRWGTQAENEADKVLHGTAIVGSMHPLAKLTEQQVVIIKRKLRAGERGSDIARAMRISTSKVSEIKHGRSWKHVQIEEAC